MQLRLEIERERALRQVAERIAAERARSLEDLRLALRMLGPGVETERPEEADPEAASTPPPARPRRWRGLGVRDTRGPEEADPEASSTPPLLPPGRWRGPGVRDTPRAEEVGPEASLTPAPARPGWWRRTFGRGS